MRFLHTLLLSSSLVLGAASCAGTGDAQPDVEPYPLDMCLVMDSKLGSMGDPISRVYEGQEGKFCCQPCVDEFEADPDYYMAQLAEQIAEK